VKLRRLIQVVDTHTAGEPTRVVTGGLPPIPGETMEEKRRWLAEHADGLRRFLLYEPRGHADMFGAILTPPTNPETHFGLVFLDCGGYLSMCGHGTIGAVTALAALGWLDEEEEEVKAITFRNVPAFYLGPLKWEGRRLEIAYGGNLFALVEAREAGLPLTREALPELVRLGMEIRRWVNANHRFQHPATGEPLVVELVEFYEEGDPPRNVVVFGEGQVDRSPCGTGTCAKMAFLHARRRLRVGEEYRHLGILGTEFVGRIVAETRVGDLPAIVPEVTGSAYVMGFGHLVLEEGDPFPEGFRLLPREGSGDETD